ncbi:unnamed protein product, partial [Phaeothamnion confervicola]
GSTDVFVGNAEFCNTCGVFQVPDCDFICAGGGSSGSGAGCGDASPNPCTSNQYKFSDANGWTINMPKSTAIGKLPYRAFAYLPFCHGSPMSSCWDGSAHDFKFSFKPDGFNGWGIYTKLLFWTDSLNILGILPRGAPGATGHSLPGNVNLVVMPTTDYPNDWAKVIPLTDGTWYNVVITVTRNSGMLFNEITVNGVTMVTNYQSTTNLDGDANGAQLGMYTFDFGQNTWGATQMAKLSLRDLSFKKVGSAPSPTPNVSTRQPTRRPTAKATHQPTAKAPSPTPKATHKPTKRLDAPTPKHTPP